MRHILLGLTGSVATVLATKLRNQLEKIGDVKTVATEPARFFIPNDFYYPNDNLHLDEDEWNQDYKLGDPIMHIELRKWASCLVIAPLDANTLAKLAHGMSDNLLTSVVRAWDWNRPLIIAPAMNSYMWDNEPTKEHLEILKRRGAFVINPVEKRLACHDVGMGAMASVENIAKLVEEKLRWLFPIKNCNGIPINHHPGAFGFHRKKNHHTGIDLYCRDGEAVYAAESGIVVNIADFTGPKVGHDWWEPTMGVMVEGATGVINYGEITPLQTLKVGDTIKRGDQVGNVKRVLFEDRYRPDIPGHSTSMLHLEFYKHGTADFADWHDLKKNPDLLDPTQHLIHAVDAPVKTLTWDNAEAKSVG